MSALGVPYTIMFETAQSGLTDVTAFVRKPDGTIVGPFAFYEGEGAFAGCYFTDYYSTITELEGRYFVRIWSNTLGRTDTTSFDLEKDGSGDVADELASRAPVNLVGYVSKNNVFGRVMSDEEILALIAPSEITGTMEPDDGIVGLARPVEAPLEGSANSSNFELNLEGN